ncbi:hypothetical protein [Clostridium botulinum]|uniref:hypothetical protein n=1 Tax=Clostridium botulinum TaxID=1491 RepID=UPI000A915173|nr:hypothetical protein [Clostridium botulinum]
MSIDFDKLLSDYLKDVEARNTRPDNEMKKLAFDIKKTAAETCIEILERYEKLKSNE